MQFAGDLQSAAGRIVYARSPFHELTHRTKLGVGGFLRLLVAHLISPFHLARLCVAWPAALLVGRDFADEALASAMARKSAIRAVVLTNSNYSAQPLWMRPRPSRRFQVHMAWYSQNVRPLLRRDDPDLPANPVNRLIRADVMWVWSQDFAAYLRSIGLQAEMRCVGPILWRLPPPRLRERPPRPVLAVFDVAPVTEVVAQRMGFIDNYYSLANCSNFLSHIIASAETASQSLGVEIDIVLKPKRDLTPRREPRYFEFIQQLAQAHPNFKVLPVSRSLYEVLEGCSLAIAIPYSSPTYVASALGRPSLFYDPTGELSPTFDAAPGLAFASGPAALLVEIERTLETELAGASAD
ncbi:MAG TPA: polysaccharide biosynthesis PFTS motif protein [Candidatus Binataceae bacterium]|nr:polysaccharide biosynthesis PFTS motif protein [Candidatus Binataceae bacterium]